MVHVGSRVRHRWRWAALAALLVAEAMNLLDTTIVAVAAPVIHAGLGGSIVDIQWFSTAYTLPFALLLITGGRLGDIAGRRRVFRVGVAGFALASLACALAPSSGALIGFRIVQGAAAAVIIPQTIGLVKAMFDGAELSTALGSIGPVMGLAAVCGPLLGGVLTHADLFGSSWRAVFGVNIPLSLLVLALTPLIIEDRAPRRPGLDPMGTLLVMTGSGLVIYPLISDTGSSWADIGVGSLVLVAFGLHQRRATRPLIEVSLFVDRAFAAALVTSTVFFAVTSGLTLVVVLQLQLGAGADVRAAGLSLLPWSAGMAVTSWVAGRYLIPRYGHRVMFAGLAVLLVGLGAAVAVYAMAAPTGYPTLLLPALGVTGLGVGLFSPAFFSTALHRLRPTEIGSAAGLINAVQQLGGTLGVAVLGKLFFRGLASGSALSGAQLAFTVAAALVTATFATAALMRPRRP
ncbi:MFS transporter [Pseudonocardia spinosispora]|uniref:MFS transporter n=1 Tax=Pseudonocardia spinosispora TaxID=103441 RepID=UPI000424F09B|nr:MFS transporter [Pseudonocardia spinosispora]